MTRQVRRRYLALKLECNRSVEQRVVADSVFDAVLRLFGEVGASQAALRLIHYDDSADYVVVRCSHTALPMLKAAIASITKVGDQPAAVHVLRVSGTLKALGRKVADNFLSI